MTPTGNEVTDTNQTNEETALVPIMIRLPPARIAQIDHCIKVEKTHTTRAGLCRDAVICYLDRPEETDLTDDMIKELQSGKLDDALKERIKTLMFSNMK